MINNDICYRDSVKCQLCLAKPGQECQKELAADILEYYNNLLFDQYSKAGNAARQSMQARINYLRKDNRPD